MKTLRPECRTASDRSTYIPRDTALFLIRDSVERRKALIHGRLHANGMHCALGAFWTDNPNTSIDANLIEEVATVNDSLGFEATPKQRWTKVRSWLRWKLRLMTPKTKAI